MVFNRAALAVMKSFLGITLSPIKTVNIRSADAASSTFTSFKVRDSGFMVVSHNCVGIISPRPLVTITVTITIGEGLALGLGFHERCISFNGVG